MVDKKLIAAAALGSVFTLVGLSITQSRWQKQALAEPLASSHSQKGIRTTGLPGSTLGGSEARRLIPFQAYLTDSDGRPVSGVVGLTFRLFDVPDGGSPLPSWTEGHPNTAVSNGLANVTIGGRTTIPNAITFDRPRFLEVQVGQDTPLTPRHEIIPAIFAADAGRAEHATTADHATRATEAGAADDATRAGVATTAGFAVSANALTSGLGSDSVVTVTNNGLEIHGSVRYETIDVSVNTTLSDEHHIVLGNSAGSIEIALPSAIGIVGREYIVKNIGTGSVTIRPVGTQTVDGVTNRYVLATQWERIRIVSDGANWQGLEGGTFPRISLKQSGGSRTIVAGGPFQFSGAPTIDTHFAWDGTQVFTAPVSGVYQMNMMVHFHTGPGPDPVPGAGSCVQAVVNDQPYHRSFQIYDANTEHLQGSDLFHLTAEDRLTFVNGCGTFVTLADSTGTYVWITIERIR